MKLLWCEECHDVVSISILEWRTCACFAIGGQYNEDGITATIGGPGKVFGIANPFFMPEFPGYPEENAAQWSPEELENIHKQYGYGPSEIWWGQYKGDTQLLFIRNPLGPRLSHRTVIRRVMAMQKSLQEAAPEGKFGNQFTPEQLNRNRKVTEKLVEDLMRRIDPSDVKKKGKR